MSQYVGVILSWVSCLTVAACSSVQSLIAKVPSTDELRQDRQGNTTFEESNQGKRKDWASGHVTGLWKELESSTPQWGEREKPAKKPPHRWLI